MSIPQISQKYLPNNFWGNISPLLVVRERPFNLFVVCGRGGGVFIFGKKRKTLSPNLIENNRLMQTISNFSSDPADFSENIQ